jgi:uncharacterized protein YjbI with pentapeptide repeats
METFEVPKYLASLIAAVNDAAKAAQTGALAFALVGLYLLATAFSATDEDLLLDRTLAISQLSAQIPVTVSFAMMPILFVALHVFTLIRYDMLAANVRQFRWDVDTTVPLAADRERCRQLLANVEFIQSLTAPPGSALRSRLFGFVAWVVIAFFPVIVLLAVQANALRYQNETVTAVQRVSLLIDLAVLFWFYNRQRRRIVTVGSDAFGVTMRRWGICVWLPVIVLGADVAWLNILPADAVLEKRPSYTQVLFRPLDYYVCPAVNWGCRFLRVDHQTLVGKVWDTKAIVELGAGQPITKVRRASFEGVFLRRRKLRHAQLADSRLYGADLSLVDLTGATLYNAELPGAALLGATLTNADLTGANLSNAILFNADLPGAGLSGANMTGARLNEADMTGAHLSGANLSNAILFGVNLTGANLDHANLSGAWVNGALLTGTHLGGATLAGANLTVANLAGALGLTQAQLDAACGQGAQLPAGLTLRPCPPEMAAGPSDLQ